VGAKNQEPELLRRGKAFHKKVQASWHEEAEGSVHSEKAVTKPLRSERNVVTRRTADQETAG
jgi:hypothetical protein